MTASGTINVKEREHTDGTFQVRVLNLTDHDVVIEQGEIVTVATLHFADEKEARTLEMPSWEMNGRGDAVALNEIAFAMATGMNSGEWTDGSKVTVSEPAKFKEQLRAIIESVSLDVTPNLDYSDMTLTDKALFTEMVRSMEQAFTPDKEVPGKTDLVKLSLNTGDHSPVAIPPRRLPYAYEQFVFDKLKSWQQNDIIRPSSSQWAAPCVVVKQGEKLRLVIDYRELNKRLDDKDLHYPITLIDSCLDVMNGAKYFTVMDISGAYHQVEIEKESKAKTAFVCKFGQFEFNRCPFGIKSLPGLWARLADKVLEGLKWQIANVFFDDICIFSRTATDHIRDVGVVLQRIIKAGLKIHMSKCKWARREVEFLGFRVGRDGVKPMEDKVKAVMDFPAPRTLTQLRSFLSLASYYRRFIEGFSTIAGPLNELLQKKTVWRWGREQREAFMALKKALCTEPVLAYPDFNLPFVLYTDASNYGIGAILAQEHPDGTIRVVSYASRSLHNAEKQYAPTHKEALAVRWAVEKYRAYLLGRHFTIMTDHKALEQLDKVKDTSGQLFRWSLFLQDFDYTIKYRPGRTHQNADTISRSPALLDISISTIEAIVGDDVCPEDGAVADLGLYELFWDGEDDDEAECVCMSERERDSESICMCQSEIDLFMCETAREDGYVLTDLERRVLLGRSKAMSQLGLDVSEILLERLGEPDVLHVNAAMADGGPISMMREDADGWSLSCDVKLLQRADEKLRPIIDYLETGVLPEGVTIEEEKRLRREAESHYIRPKDDVLMRIWAAQRSKKRVTAFHQVVLPEPLIPYVLKAYHEHALGGHLGFAKTYEKILRKYYWRSVYADVFQFISSCKTCRSRKNPTRTRRHKLGQRPPAWKPFQRVSADFVKMACPSKKGNKMVLVLIDHLTHWIELFACKEETAEVVAKCLHEEIVCRYGCPGELHSDNGPQFTSEVIKELTALLGMDRSTTTPYRHQANGMAERAIKTMLGMLGTVVSETHDDWDECLPSVRMAYNTSFNKAAGETPFFLIYGTDPNMPSDYVLGADEPEYAGMKEYNQRLVQRLRVAWRAAEESNAEAQAEHRERHIRKPGKGFVTYETNDLVYVFSPVKPTGLSRKLLRQWSGPYRVVDKAKESVYLVVPANGKAARPMPVHVERLKVFTERQQRLAGKPVMSARELEQDPAAAPEERVPPIESLQRRAQQSRPPTTAETALIGKIFYWKKKKNSLYQIRSVSWSEDHGQVVAGCRPIKLNKKNKVLPAEGSRRALETVSIDEALEFVTRDARLNERAILSILLSE
jgi:transposase InsO family protein